MSLMEKIKDLAGDILRGDVEPADDNESDAASKGPSQDEGADAAPAADEPAPSGDDDADEAAAAWTVMNNDDK